MGVNEQLDKIKVLKQELSVERTAKLEASQKVESLTLEVTNLNLKIEQLTGDFKLQQADGGALLAKLRAEIETLTASIAKFKLEIKGMQPLVDEHPTLLIKIEDLERQLAQSTSAAAIFISETKLVANASAISWEDELKF